MVINKIKGAISTKDKLVIYDLTGNTIRSLEKLARYAISNDKEIVYKKVHVFITKDSEELLCKLVTILKAYDIMKYSQLKIYIHGARYLIPDNTKMEYCTSDYLILRDKDRKKECIIVNYKGYNECNNDNLSF